MIRTLEFINERICKLGFIVNFTMIRELTVSTFLSIPRPPRLAQDTLMTEDLSEATSMSATSCDGSVAALCSFVTETVGCDVTDLFVLDVLACVSDAQ